jgi:SNF2-related domain
MPKSLIFNWRQEAARFTPHLRVLDHTGSLRQRGNGHFEEYDVILTTYGTLRNDAVDFKDTRFDYVILEAQAIKNADSVQGTPPNSAKMSEGHFRHIKKIAPGVIGGVRSLACVWRSVLSLLFNGLVSVSAIPPLRTHAFFESLASCLHLL